MSVYNYMTLDATGANAGTSAYDINNAGQIVGSYTFVPGGLFPTQKYGFIYNPQAPYSPPRRASTMWARSSGIT
jgi:uncharacterized membrane protein